MRQIVNKDVIGYLVACLGAMMVLGCSDAASPPADQDGASGTHYEFAPATRDGIGKFYQGREICTGNQPGIGDGV